MDQPEKPEENKVERENALVIANDASGSSKNEGSAISQISNQAQISNQSLEAIKKAIQIRNGQVDKAAERRLIAIAIGGNCGLALTYQLAIGLIANTTYTFMSLSGMTYFFSAFMMFAAICASAGMGLLSVNAISRIVKTNRKEMLPKLALFGGYSWLGAMICLYFHVLLPTPVMLQYVLFLTAMVGANMFAQQRMARKIVLKEEAVLIEKAKGEEALVAAIENLAKQNEIAEANKQADAAGDGKYTEGAKPTDVAQAQAKEQAAKSQAQPEKKNEKLIAQAEFEKLLFDLKATESLTDANAIAFKCLQKLSPTKPPKPSDDLVHVLTDELIKRKRVKDADVISQHYLQLLEKE